MRRFFASGALTVIVTFGLVSFAQDKKADTNSKKNLRMESYSKSKYHVEASSEGRDELDCYRCGFGREFGYLNKEYCEQNHKIWDKKYDEIKSTCH